MLISAVKTIGCRARAIDGDIGAVKDLHFTEPGWGICHLVVASGHAAHASAVMLPPPAVGRPMVEDGVLPLRLTRRQVRSCPDTDSHMTVSRLHAVKAAKHVWPASPSRWHTVPRPTAGLHHRHYPEAGVQASRHLVRSVKQVCGYTIISLNGKDGRMRDMILTVPDWLIKYLVIDTGALLAHRAVLVPSALIGRMDWNSSAVHLEVTREQLRFGPAYDPTAGPPDREDEARIHEYYGLPVRWH